MTSLVVVIGLLGACAVLIVLIDSPGTTPAVPGSADRAGTPAAPATPAGAAGLRLMKAAAAACGALAFHGIQVDSWPDAVGRAPADVEVWHQPGQAVLAQYAAGAPAADRPAATSAAGTALPDQADVLTVTVPLLTLMRQHYVLAYAGPAAADGRAALVIEVRRPAGGVAARYWLDRATGLPLRREL
ncbi:MAG TPA: hypothetical protein VIZ00_07600, partial [Streptosporangiaceae bacterium]